MRHHVRRTVLVVFGVLFIAFGVGAFLGVPGGHDGAHHTTGHNLTHIIAGVVILMIAWGGNSGKRRGLCYAFAAVYLAIGFLGVFSVKDSLKIIPGLVEFHLEDSWVQITTGLLFLALALIRKIPAREQRAALGT